MLTPYAIRKGVAQELTLRQFTFPGGEIQVQVETPTDNGAVESLLIDAHLPDAQEVMALLMLTDALRRAYPNAPIALRLPYVPYARQDRVCNPGEALGIRVFCDLVNAQNYCQVTIMDPHSDVTPALLNRVTIEDVTPLIARAVQTLGEVALVAPDAGAVKRVSSLAKRLGGLPVVFAEKIRDTQTGNITGVRVSGELPACGLLLVDDICDGGRTFIELAGALRAKQEAQGIDAPLYLYVSHGIFSKGLEVLTPHFARIFTPNDWTQSSNEQLTITR